MKRLILLTAAALAISATCAQAEPKVLTLHDIQHEWAEINYSTTDQDRVEAFEALAEKTLQALDMQPRNPALMTWAGIVHSTWAGTKGGLGALGLAKKARLFFEQAIEIDGSVLNGSAHTSLGVLYHEVPGWPIGFGNEKKARAQLEQGLGFSPDGIDANYFMGVWLMDQKRYAEASVLLERALAAGDRSDRPLADRGRRQEIRQALKKLREYQE
ncbi:MAG: hypothetical protein RQ741_03905 [Wenzhouxiangellaceae bacterium]|nr:hypothetical protein [Wenzhouxiangellaceae bacterium]